MFQEFITYKKVHNFTNIPPRQSQLRSWIHWQRTCYKRKNLSKDRINRLESIGFVWILPDEQWNQMFEQLISYKHKFQSINVSSSHAKLWSWTHAQRYHYKNKKLSIDRINRLES